jgi:Tol biopolymer transport system component
MPDLDELIRGRLQARARPVDAGPALFEGIDRRRARRVVKRRVGSATATLAFIVAVVGGFALVGSSGGVAPATHTATPPPRSQNGEIVSVVVGVNHLSSLWAGSTQLTPDGTLVGETAFIDRAPSVYPSGSLVAFTRQVMASGNAGLYTVPFHGTPAGPCPTCGFVATQLLDSSWLVSDPAWSPDGSQIAFAGGGPSRAVGIYIVGVIPPTKPRLVYAAPTDLSVVAHPSWSPDGSRLVFAQANAALSTPPDFDLYVVAADGTGTANDITPGSYNVAGTSIPGSDSQVQPAWSPDGNLIAFASQQSGSRSLVSSSALTLISPDGTGLRYLTGGVLLDQNPSWSPDGKQIVFESETSSPIGTIGSRVGIFTMPATGGPQSFVRFGSDPSWQPVQNASDQGIQGASPTTMIPGVSYPVCQADVLGAFFLNDVETPPVYLFTKPGVLGCRQTSSAPAFLAIEVHGLGPFPSTVVTGPIACSPTCRILAAPDLNGDGASELAVAVTGGGRMFGVQLYRVAQDGHFAPVLSGLGDPFFFNWGRSGNYRAGIACSPGSSMDIWTATRHSGIWRISHLSAKLHGNTIQRTLGYTSTVSRVSELPAGGGSDFCGARVLLRSYPGP